ncbi:MAG: hypothetical protein LBQ81_13735 [Zoogloeaceae bacterium]|jgi:hypothetical protein|nr:hypothetical protein [Zoogloeaceae bacterium]
MKAIIFLIGLIAMECCANEPVPRLTGERLIQYFFSEKALENEFANGYLASIVDATQGDFGCATWKQKPHEIDADIAHELRKLPQERLREKASVLVTEALKKKFPCK